MGEWATTRNGEVADVPEGLTVGRSSCSSALYGLIRYIPNRRIPDERELVPTADPFGIYQTDLH